MANQKDIIYVDTDDDITAVIAKVKKSSERVIAMVPPKRANMLASVVNLRLLKRAAEDGDKKLVLITNEAVLTSMAGGIGLFVAKDLKTPPSIPKVETADLPSNVIEAESLPAPVAKPDDAPETADSLAGKTAVASAAEKTLPAASPAAAKAGKKPGKGKKVPDINKFRKLIFIGIGGLLLLIVLIWWAFFFAPRAEVTLRAQTEDVPIESPVNLSTDVGSFEENTNTVPATRQTIEEDLSEDFDATGEKDVGKKATGTVRLSRLSPSETTVPAGTELTSSSGKKYTTDENAVIPPSSPCFPNFCAESTEVGITAVERGSSYNGAKGEMSGTSNGTEAKIVGATGGGSSKVVTVVDQSDINEAKSRLDPKEKSSAISELTKKFDDNEDLIIFEGTYQTETSNESSTADAGDEKSGGTVKQTVTHSLLAVKQKDYEALIDSLAEDDLAEGLKVFDYGADEAEITAGDSDSYTLSAQAEAGPDVDFDDLASRLAGQRFSAAVETAEQEKGVTEADVDLQPFWVFSVPKNTEKINITIEQPESDK